MKQSGAGGAATRVLTITNYPFNKSRSLFLRLSKRN